MAAGGLLLGQDKAKRDMITLSARPEDLEMPLTGFSDYITPVEHFFVRTHVYVPTVEIGEWRLKVEGEVAKPLTLTMDDIKKMPAVEMVAVVECAGNGRVACINRWFPVCNGPTAASAMRDGAACGWATC